MVIIIKKLYSSTRGTLHFIYNTSFRQKSKIRASDLISCGQDDHGYLLRPKIRRLAEQVGDWRDNLYSFLQVQSVQNQPKTGLMEKEGDLCPSLMHTTGMQLGYDMTHNNKIKYLFCDFPYSVGNNIAMSRLHVLKTLITIIITTYFKYQLI